MSAVSVALDCVCVFVKFIVVKSCNFRTEHCTKCPAGCVSYIHLNNSLLFFLKCRHKLFLKDCCIKCFFKSEIIPVLMFIIHFFIIGKWVVKY